MARLPHRLGHVDSHHTYRARQGGRQYVVVAAGGHGKAGDKLKLDNSPVAFALP
jgi:glucose dehydrogenase